MGNILRSFGFSSHENPRNPTEIHENLKKELIFPWITFCNRESMIIHGQITVDFRLFTKIHVYKLRGFPLQTEIHENAKLFFRGFLLQTKIHVNIKFCGFPCAKGHPCRSTSLSFLRQLL